MASKLSKPHTAARSSPYQQGGPARIALEDAQVPWSVPLPGYAPVSYTADIVAKKPFWADDEDKLSQIKFNTMDGQVNRLSFMGVYAIDAKGIPINPCGRTGITGRGLLGRFGPNHAADPIVSRWKRDAHGKVSKRDGKPVFEFVCIQRKDNGQWAIPGGMVDAGEQISLTLKREFGEEALNTLDASAEEKARLSALLDKEFHLGTEIYKGYVDDPRNTDQAWMETVAVNFHDDTGKGLGAFKLHAGDDAGAVKWTAYSPDIQLYASHRDFIEKSYHLRLAAFKDA